MQPFVPADPPDQIEISYSAADQGYDLKVPGVPRGRLVPGFPAQNFNVFRLPWSGTDQISVELYRPGTANTELALFHTSLGFWYGTRISLASSNRFEEASGEFVYGVPTALLNVPATGSSVYSGIIVGGGIGMDGQVSLSIDFSSGVISGGIVPAINDGIGGVASPGLQEFIAATLSPDRSVFSGRFSGRCATPQDFFEGRFTGPRAEELMVRWRATIYNPHNVRCEPFSGIWVAKQA